MAEFDDAVRKECVKGKGEAVTIDTGMDEDSEDGYGLGVVSRRTTVDLADVDKLLELERELGDVIVGIELLPLPRVAVGRGESSLV